jgi:heme exporter protein A
MEIPAPLPARNLTVSSLYCSRGGHEILADLSFSVAPKTMLLLRGPNGAGKSTLLMCLAGILRPDEGTIDWQGRDPEALPGADMHFIGHRPAIKSGLTVRENLGFWADIHGVGPQFVDKALESAGLAHAADFDAAYLSAGQVRRLSLARLIAIPRPIWLLDEPTAALDAQGDQWVAELIEQQVQNGGLVVAATHLDIGKKKTAKTQTLNLGAAQ